MLTAPYRVALVGCGLPGGAARRTLVERWGGYADGDFPEDDELWLR
jgi:hypothetical protein